MSYFFLVPHWFVEHKCAGRIEKKSQAEILTNTVWCHSRVQQLQRKRERKLALLVSFASNYSHSIQFNPLPNGCFQLPEPHCRLFMACNYLRLNQVPRWVVQVLIAVFPPFIYPPLPFLIEVPLTLNKVFLSAATYGLVESSVWPQSTPWAWLIHYHLMFST